MQRKLSGLVWTIEVAQEVRPSENARHDSSARVASASFARYLQMNALLIVAEEEHSKRSLARWSRAVRRRYWEPGETRTHEARDGEKELVADHPRCTALAVHVGGVELLQAGRERWLLLEP